MIKRLGLPILSHSEANLPCDNAFVLHCCPIIGMSTAKAHDPNGHIALSIVMPVRLLLIRF